MKQEQLYKFFEGTTTYEEETAIRQWMEQSEENRRTFLRERKLFDALLLLGDTDPSQKEEKEPGNKRKSLRIFLLKITAAAALFAGILFAYESIRQANEPLAMQTLTVPTGQRIHLTLPDGTGVWLNARTTLRYPALFSKNRRTVQLDGEAYFDVAKDPERPFIVETNRYCVEVLGTRFNVEAYGENDTFETTLMQGSVKLVSRKDPGEVLLLTPDHKATLKKGRLEITPVEDYNPYRWKEGLICFKDASFLDIMKTFEKYYGIPIRVENQKVQKFFYTGKFRQADGIDYALRVLQKDIRFEYVRDEENQTIVIR